MNGALSCFGSYLTFLQIPKIVNWEDYVPEGSDQWESQKAISRLFDERPIWPKNSIQECFLDKGLNFSTEMLRRFFTSLL